MRVCVCDDVLTLIAHAHAHMHMQLTIDAEQGQSAWRALLNRLNSVDRDSVLESLRAMLLADEAAASAHEPTSVPDAARQHLMSLLGEVGDEAAATLLLELARAAPNNSRDRYAFMNQVIIIIIICSARCSHLNDQQ